MTSLDASAFRDLVSAHLTLVALELDHEDDRPDDLGSAIARAGATLHASDLVARHAHTVQRNLIIGCVDRVSTRRAVDAIRAMRGVRIVAEEDLAFARHRGGKLKVTSRFALDNSIDHEALCGSGATRVCQAIAEQPRLAWDLTGMGRTVGILSRGACVPGVGAAAPLASLPAVESIAVLYHQLAGVGAVPLIVAVEGVEDFIATVTRVSSGFGLLHLAHLGFEDAGLEQALQQRTGKLCFRADRHGVAVAALAGAIKATRLLGMDLREVIVGQVGLGVTGASIVSLLSAYGVRTVVAHDREDTRAAILAGTPARLVSLDEVMRTAAVVIAATGGDPLIPSGAIRRGQIVLALSTSRPEIAAQAAYAAGASLAADHQTLHEALVFPGLVRALLRGRATTLGADVLVAAALAIAGGRVRAGWLPDLHDPRLHGDVYAAVRDALPEPTLILPPGIEERWR